MISFRVPQSESPLAEWLSYLETLHEKEIDLGLERVKKVAHRLDLLKLPGSHVITVGGTNGKGTTCRLLETMILASGRSVGVYSSPHLLNYQERVRIQGVQLSESEHSAAMSLVEEHRAGVSLSYFEFSTLSVLHILRRRVPEIVLLEVGLGGRLDATNVVDPDISVITNIDVDHAQFLGGGRTEVAREKIGIFRPGRTAVVGDPDCPKIVYTSALESGVPLQVCGRDWGWKVEGNGWSWWNKSGHLSNLPLTQIPLENAATALTVAHCLPFSISEDVIREKLRSTFLTGRFQLIRQNPKVIVDVAHNPHATRHLSERLTTLNCRGKFFAIIGVMRDKDINGMILHLRGQISAWCCVSIDTPRGARASDISRHLGAERGMEFRGVREALEYLTRIVSVEDYILVFGSFHIVSSAMRLLGAE